jgi:opacity protein-like surface antigen
MSMKAMLLAAATAATLLAPAAAMAQDYGHQWRSEGRDAVRAESWRGHDRDRGYDRGYRYRPAYGYGYRAYGYDSDYRYAAPASRYRDERGSRGHEHHRDWYRPY